jgi:peroxiredoxin
VDRTGHIWSSSGRYSPLGTLLPMLSVGDKAPEFKLPTTGGHDLTLAEALEKHKALVFLFYVLDFTGG